MLWGAVLVILNYGLADAGKAKIRDSLASTICGAMKSYSSTKQIVGPLKIPNHSDNSENCKICRAIKWNDCKSNDCQKFNYVPCANQESSSVPSGKSLGRSTRIINGRDVYPNELPFLVRLQMAGTHLCGSSIYNKNWLVIAAHCVWFLNENTLPNLVIVAGDHFRSKVDPTEQKVRAKSIVVHDKFNHTNGWHFDIALVQVSPPFKFNSAVSPICLASHADQVPVGQKVRVSGWGTTDLKDATPNATPEIPKVVQIRVISIEECKSLYIDYFNITQGNICALPETSTPAGGCVGDSGGPLFMDKDDGSRFLVGLVNGGGPPECSGPKAPSVYASITHYHEWIVAHAVDTI